MEKSGKLIAYVLRHNKIDAGQMVADGYAFYISANGVWLTKEVPFKYVTEIIRRNG